MRFLRRGKTGLEPQALRAMLVCIDAGKHGDTKPHLGLEPCWLQRNLVAGRVAWLRDSANTFFLVRGMRFLRRGKTGLEPQALRAMLVYIDAGRHGDTGWHRRNLVTGCN